MARPNKYEKGEVIATFNQLFNHIVHGRYIFIRHKPTHPGWVESMQFRELAKCIYRGWLFTAKISNEWTAYENRRLDRKFRRENGIL